MIRPYLAILKDSFREALASRVLLVTLLGIVVVLLLLAPFGLGTSVSTRLRPSELERPERLLERLSEDSSDPASPAGHLWSLLDTDQRQRLEDLQDPQGDRRGSRRPGPNPQKRRLVSVLNDLLRHNDFYRAEVWQGLELTEEAQRLTQQARLDEEQEQRRNLLLLAAAFPRSIQIVDSRAISLTYGTAVVQGPVPLTPDQFEELFEQILIAVVGVFLGFFGVFGCLLVTAGLIPRTFEAGEIALLLSKPVSRSALFIVKFFGGCVFTLLYATVLVTGIWLLLGLRMDFWRHELVWCIPVYLFLFMIYYSVSAVAGAIWRNSIVALSLVVVFWLLVTVFGATREALQYSLIEERGIHEIVCAGESVLTVDGEQHTWVWDAETDAWRRVFRETSGGMGELARFLFGSSAQLAPVYDPAEDRILALQHLPSRFGGRGASKLVAGYADDDWDRIELAQLPEFIPQVLINHEGRILLPGRQALYEFTGQTDTARRQAEFLSRISGGLLGRTTNGLQEVQPADWPDPGEQFSVALNPVCDDLWICAEGVLHHLAQDSSGAWQLKDSVPTTAEQTGLVAVGGSHGILALDDGTVRILDAESMTTVAEHALPESDHPVKCAVSEEGDRLAVLTESGQLVLYSTELARWTVFSQDKYGALAWSPRNTLMTSDGRLAVDEWTDGDVEGAPSRSWAEAVPWIYHLFDYVIVPAWTILPRPYELDNFVAYVMTRDDGEEQRRTGLLDGPGDRPDGAEQEVFDPQPVLRHNLIFVLVLLGFGCVYIGRRDF